MSIVLVVASACDPPAGPFRPAPASPTLACRPWPKVPADLAPALIPRVDIDINHDDEPDYVARSNCDADGNCDLAGYVSMKSCAVLVAQVRGAEIRVNHMALTAVERFVRDGAEVRRETAWPRDPRTGGFLSATKASCIRSPDNTVVDCDQALGATPSISTAPGVVTNAP